jgi:hypothetical protein
LNAMVSASAMQPRRKALPTSQSPYDPSPLMLLAVAMRVNQGHK